MTATPLTHPMLTIRTADTSASATVTPGDRFGVWHEAESWTVPDSAALLDALLAQGYALERWTRADGSVVAWAYSPDYAAGKGLL